ncbi:hypothetical protein [Mesorhizobium sp.]|uniref:hypothetical protein n=1 Tax=Mesorhizobium sp. TaxID=1871066 RepID=UPI000FE5EC79|nr:hypothetical protein [Mesorhizobium sp.]RWF62550.1 MAG: hypothetical protein EOS47_23000 [Mesorhizobium sp.]TIT43834.1 MAG: hypothetical protein E5W76_04980 [Mesorhizobium sp.]
MATESQPDAAPPRLPKSESLEAKFKLAIALPYDGRAKRKHMLVFGFILDWFHSKYGDALASVRHVVDELEARDPAGKGLGRTSVNDALADLVAWGWLRQEDGAGRNANRYVPAWDKVCVHPVVDTTEGETCVHPVVDAGVHPVVDTNADSVHPVPDEDPLTVTGPQDPVTGKSNPVAPAGGPDAVAPAAAVGFERAWLAYGKHGGKKAARSEWAALPPGVDVEHIIARAASWAASAKPGQKRMPFEKWLTEERYDEADRRPSRPLPTLPKVRKGATRRDADIDGIEFDGRLVCVKLRWLDAEEGENDTYVHRLSKDKFAEMLRQLDASEYHEIEYHRVLVDFWYGKDEEEYERWYRYPDELNDNLPRDEDGEDTIRSLHWKEAA